MLSIPASVPHVVHAVELKRQLFNYATETIKLVFTIINAFADWHYNTGFTFESEENKEEMAKKKSSEVNEKVLMLKKIIKQKNEDGSFALSDEQREELWNDMCEARHKWETKCGTYKLPTDLDSMTGAMPDYVKQRLDHFHAQKKAVDQVANTPADKRTIFQIICSVIERGALKDLQILAQSPCFNLHQVYDQQDLLRVSVKYRRQDIVQWLLNKGVTNYLNQAMHDVLDAYFMDHALASDQSTLCDILRCLLEKDPTVPYCKGVHGMAMPVLRALQSDAGDCYLPMLRHGIPSAAMDELRNLGQLSPPARAALDAAFLRPQLNPPQQQNNRTKPSIPERPSDTQVSIFLKQLAAQVDAMEAQHSKALKKLVAETEDRMRCVLNCSITSLRVQDQQCMEANLVDHVARYLEECAQDDVLPAAQIQPDMLEQQCHLPKAVARDLSIFLGMVRGDNLADILKTSRLLAAKLLQENLVAT